MKISPSTICLLSVIGTSVAFAPIQRCHHQVVADSFTTTRIFAEGEGGVDGGEVVSSDGDDEGIVAVEPEYTFASEEEKDEAVGNLVADDEWSGLGMELSEVISKAVVEDLKNNAKEFLGKDDYAVGDITKEVDSRVKAEIAKMRGKEEYELGDFTVAMDEMSKKMVEEMTGKPYEVGDLSTLIDAGIKEKVASFCGKDEYEFGDLSTEMNKRIKSGVSEFTGKEGYQFGDISKEINERRQKWAKETLGEEYQFGDVSFYNLVADSAIDAVVFLRLAFNSFASFYLFISLACTYVFVCLSHIADDEKLPCKCNRR